MALDLKAPAGPLEKLGACLQPFKKAPDEKWDEALWYDEGLDDDHHASGYLDRGR